VVSVIVPLVRDNQQVKYYEVLTYYSSFVEYAVPAGGLCGRDLP
jgi:hypothetical protein